MTKLLPVICPLILLISKQAQSATRQLGNRHRQSLTYDDFGAHSLAPYGQWAVPDSRSEDFYNISPFSYCGGDPINRIVPDGKEWRIVFDDDNIPEFEWVEHQKALDSKGNLLPNHYEQAILFIDEEGKNSFNEKSDYNIGTSIAKVYKADGSTEQFDACTYPSDTSKYPTIPSGIYEAKVGKHKINSPNGYLALRMSDVGTTDFYSNSIELGEPNKAFPDRTYAIGINIHKAGVENKTGKTKNGSAVSMGCLLIDRYNWKNFIKIFTTPQQKNNVVGIILLRLL